jgi:ubiquinone/menaquinone biosynthesis C-methylase UbiE
MSKESRFKREALFHDNWAMSENIDEVIISGFFENITSLENKFILSRIGSLKDKKVLDIGCGLGESSVYFAKKGAKVTAVDISSEMINNAKEMARRENAVVNFIALPIEDLSLELESFDIVYCANLIHHLSIESLPKFIEKVHSFLKKGGWFYSWDPLVYNPVIKIYRRLAKEVRSADEAPLNFKILKLFRKKFTKVYHKEFWLLTLTLFLKYYFINKYDPNKIRYWKQIYKEKPEEISWWFSKLEKGDSVLLKVPFLKRLAWNIVIYAQKQ